MGGDKGLMLLSFRVSNHRSLRHEQQLLLTPGYSADDPDGTSRGAVTVAGIFGPNASGKSNVIDALAYMQNMVRGSLRESEPGEGIERHPFALDAGASGEPSSYVVDLLVEGIRYTYGFSVDDVQVVDEWMHSYPHKRKRRIFSRHFDDYDYGEQSPDSMRSVEEITESNVLYLSVAARSRQPIVRPVYDWFVSLLTRTQVTLRYQIVVGTRVLESQGYLGRLTDLLRSADTGIEGAELVEETDEEWAARLARRKGLPETPRRKEIFFRHRGADGSFSLSLRDQSLGTRALFELGVPAFMSLDRGTVLVVDELDSSLHPFLTAQLIGLFRDAETNPHGAQLIFSSHDAALLGRIQGEEVLHRDHVWFTEKDECGVTELFPLSDFKPRKDENRERRYLAGRYGAVPIINDELFSAAVAGREELDDVSPDT